MKKPTIGLLLLGSAALLPAMGLQAKKALGHDDFDNWKLVSNHLLTRNGQWGAYSVNAQQGDGVLTFYNTKSGKKIEIERGYKPAFTADGRWGIASIKPFYADTRKAKIDKKKDFDMPQDSLAIVNLATGAIEKIPCVISYKIGKEGGDWLTYQSCDTTFISPKALKDKKAGRPLIVRHLPSGTQTKINWSKDYELSRTGRSLAITLKPHESDSTAIAGAGLLNLPDTSMVWLDSVHRNYGAPVFDYSGNRLALTVSNDSNETGTQTFDLLLADSGKDGLSTEILTIREYPAGRMNLTRPHAADSTVQERLMQQWYENNARQEREALKPNQYSKPAFSHNGKRVVIGVAASVAPNDTTIVDFEQPELDIWRWDSPMTPPQENKNVEKLRKHTFPAVIDIESGNWKVLTTNPLATVNEADRWDADWALIHDPSKEIVSHQWDYYAPEEISIVNAATGEVRNIGTVTKENAEISPSGRYVVWFEGRDYMVYDIADDTTRNVSKDVEVPLWDETDDHPMIPQPHGLAGWSKDDNELLVYDLYDIWVLDPKGIRTPYTLTGGEGRRQNRRYRYLKTDPEHRFFSPGEEMLLTIFDYTTKENGLATSKYGKAAKPETDILAGYSFTQLKKAQEADVYSFVKANFSVLPDVYSSTGKKFGSARKLSDANPQAKEFNWGTARLEKWYAYDGKPSEGVLYVPDDFDPEKKYPMLCVFYETGSEELYTHYTMQPSWSWVNYPFYVSRGYVVFVPDIHYTAGIPGECAYNYVCSGAEEMCKRYPWIDRERIGIDGQSWGGYQTAYLVTRTNMFACAGSGAPVANMTSAFGGIRWESGDSRQAQYEMGQSRIGRNLWDATELYVANSPVFHANRVNTPLLIMHNDADGAVPWYQGIEMFMALRRLGKPVWMLQYNGEAHNLRERKNRKDITIRLQQFFDHYLKGEPMPEWMKNGIPAIRKGQELGY